MKKLFSALCITLLAFSAATAFADEKDDEKKKKKPTAAEKRAEIDQVAKETLDDLFGKSEKAKELYDKAAGYAVFDNTRVTFIVTGGGGAGVAVNKKSGDRTYMKMGTGGLAFGIGAQKYQVIMFFETAEKLADFIEHGWKAESSANAAAGTAGANAGTGFIDGIAVFQVTEAGLMASADISGTKYSIDKKLNE
jgi:lipid-binding SYLF domain-containing protein